MNLTVKFFGDCVGSIPVWEKLQLCLLSHVFRQWPYALQVRFGNGVWNEDGINAGQIEPGHVGCDVRFCFALRRRSLRLFPAGFAVNRKRFSRQFIVASIDLTRTKVRAVKKYL